MDEFRREVDIATGALLAIVPERESWNPRELRELVKERTGIDNGSVHMTALTTLANPEADGRLFLDAHLNVCASPPSSGSGRGTGK